MPERRPPRRPTAGSWRCSREHLCQGWLEGYLLTGRHGLFNCYEAFIHIVDSMFNQHAKWLKVTRDIPWRAPDRVAELPADLARLAPGPQRLHPPGPGLHRPRREQEGRDRPRLPAAGRQHPAVGRRPLPAQPRLRQRDRRRQAAGAALPDHGRGGRALHARARHLGLGQHRRAAASPTSCSPAPATSRPWRRSPPPTCCAQHLPELKVRVVNVVDLMRLQPDTEHPHGLSDREFDALFTTRQAGHLRLPRLPVADPPPHLPPHQPRQHPRPRLQGGGHHHHAVRHGDAQRPRPLPPRHGRHRPGARPAASAPRTCASRWSTPACRARAYTREHGEDRPEHRRTGPGPGVAASVTGAGAGGQRRVQQPQAAPARRRRHRLGAADTRPAEHGSCGPGRAHRRTGAAGRRPTRSGTGSCTAAREFAAPVRIDDAVDAAAARPHRPRPAAPAEVAGRHSTPCTTCCPTCRPWRCFDTAFHATLPDAASTYALPAEWRERYGLRRYGFHGLSHAYASRRAAELTGARADRGGPSRRGRLAVRGARRAFGGHHDGLHAAGGAGDGDPVRQRRSRPAAVAEHRCGDPGRASWPTALEHRSGLLGLAGTADMREVVATGRPRRPGSPLTSTSTGCAGRSPR